MAIFIVRKVNRYIFAFISVLIGLICFTAWSGCAPSKLSHDEKTPKAYGKAIELKSEDPEVCYNKGISLNKLGRHKEAQDAFDKAERLGNDG